MPLVRTYLRRNRPNTHRDEFILSDVKENGLYQPQVYVRRGVLEEEIPKGGKQ